MSYSNGFLAVITIVNIFLLLFATFNIFKKKHLANILLLMGMFSLITLEIAKFAYFMSTPLADNILGLGLCMGALFWLISSVCFLPSRSYSMVRLFVSPFLVIVSLIFFFIWWIKPFFLIKDYYISPLAKYFFLTMIISLSVTLSNFERSYYYLKDKRVKLLFISALFFLLPYIMLATYTIIFSRINLNFLFYSSLSILWGGLIFFVASKDGFSFEEVKETTALHTSLVLILIGGYLFFIGILVKLFQVFGWNLTTFFSFITTLIIFFGFFLVISSSFKERLKRFLLKNFSRQGYDWQKIWEEFTNKLSLVTEIEKIKEILRAYVLKIANVRNVEVFIFEDAFFPFEVGFADWLLRYGKVLYTDIFTKENKLSVRFPQAKSFLEKRDIDLVVPLYGNKKILGLMGLKRKDIKPIDEEFLRVISLQASSVILSCYANKTLREAERKDSIYKMTSFVIHDVKNYVNSLSLLVTNRDKFNNPEFREDLFFTLENTLNKMQRLIDEFRTLRGDIILQQKYINLSSLIGEALRDVGKEKLKRIDVINEIDSSWEVYVDTHYFHKVILNILINATEAIEDKGEIRIWAEKDKSNLNLFIKDNGRGMSRDFIDNKLFKTFASTKERGMGIGLYQCKRIVEAHQGRIEVDSLLNKGTLFKIILPKVSSTVMINS